MSDLVLWGYGNNSLIYQTTRTWFVAGILLVSLAGASLAGQECPKGLEPATEFRMLFGLIDKEGKAVTKDQWRQFLADTVTPRFPDGLTVFDGKGQWLAPSGKLLREPVKVVLIASWSDRAQGMKLVEEISAEYTKRFNQDSVFRMAGTTCAG